MHDVSAENPAKRDDLLKLWDQYVKENGVLLTGDGMPALVPGIHVFESFSK